MKYYTMFIFLFASLAVFLSCSSTKNVERNIKGTVITVGNEPFTNLALKVSDEEVYLLKFENKEQEKELTANQGKHYTISYTDNKTHIAGDTIQVKKIEPAN